MIDDERCCGTGTCMIDAQGRCWCGQQWNGSTMCAPTLPAHPSEPATADASATTNVGAGADASPS